MLEDKLTHAERVRLECLQQAQNTIGPGVGVRLLSNQVDTIKKLALEYEVFLLAANQNEHS